LQEHRTLLAALLARDAKAAHAAMKQHIQNGLQAAA
jgi:DNA-binding GntR family transcriptional regulator